MLQLTMLFAWLVAIVPIIFAMVMIFRLVKAVEKIADTYSRRNN